MIDIKSLHAGDVIRLNETIYTARDQAHLRLKRIIDNNEQLPINLKDSFIYYAGPTPTKPDGSIGSIGPTTSARMDAFVEYMEKLGIKGMIGKGPRSEKVRQYCKEHKIVYLIATGGAGALLAKKIVKVEEVAFEDLGCESIKKMEVKDFPVIVAFDTYGNSVFDK